MIDVPKDIRIQRVKNRSFEKFGDRMLSGGDLYEQEEKFFALVQSRAEDIDLIIECVQNEDFMIQQGQLTDR